MFVGCNIHSYALVSKMVLAGAVCFQCGFGGSKWKHIESSVHIQLSFTCVHSSSAVSSAESERVT